VTLTAHETHRLGSICIETQCPHLGPKGCVLGETKPLSCSLYPLAYDPSEDQFYFDTECPLHEDYVAELNDRDSDASRHLASMAAKLRPLRATEPDYLAENFAIDVDYFELEPISNPSPGFKA